MSRYSHKVAYCHRPFSYRLDTKIIAIYRTPTNLLISLFASLLCATIGFPRIADATPGVSALIQHNQANKKGGINATGAHFSWIIFDTLKSDLEKTSGRKINFLGKNPMLGQGCNAGIKSAQLNGQTSESFGFICCIITPEEIKQKQLTVYPLALEPILILLNKANPVKNLSMQEVRDIFAGKITNWRAVGGNDRPIVVITRLHCENRPGHWKTILPNKDQFRQQSINVLSANELVQRISDFPEAIGHTGATWLFDSKHDIKHITVNAVEPNADSLAAQTYPFFRQLSAVTNESPSSDLLKIISEVQTGPAFFEFAKKFRLLPLNPARTQ